MAHLNGPPGWTIPKPKLDAAAVEKRSREIAIEFESLFIAFGLAAVRLASSGDALGLTCFSVAAKCLLADAVSQCADKLGAADVLD